MLSQEANRVRCYHEAGHALLALHLGVRLQDLWPGDIARTRYDQETYTQASAHDQALLALGGAVAEEVVFGERSPDCCTHDFDRLEEILAKLGPKGPCRDELRHELEAEAREVLSRGPFRAALDVLVEELLKPPFMIAGRWVPELLSRKCSEVIPFLRVRPY